MGVCVCDRERETELERERERKRKRGGGNEGKQCREKLRYPSEILYDGGDEE